MGKKVPLTNGIGGPTIGTAMVINSNDPIKEFGAFTRIDGVLVGMVITDPEVRKAIQGDLGAMSITPRSVHDITMDFAKTIDETDGEAIALGMQDEIDPDFDVDGYLAPYDNIYNPGYATRHMTEFIEGNGD